MKVLQICSKSPYPPSEGGPIAMNNITQGLIEKGHHVKVFTVSTKKYPVQLEKIPSSYIKKTNFEHVFIDTSVTLLKALANFFSPNSFHISRFYSKKFEARLIEILRLNTFDIIQFESIYVAPYLAVVRKFSKAVCVLRAHNIEHLIWKRLTEGERKPLRKLYLGYLTAKLKRYEFFILNNFDGVAAITQVDADFFINSGVKTNVTSIPFGIPIQQIVYRPIENRTFPGIFHLGSMDWLPNQEGIHWLINEIWPKVIARNPDAELKLAGRNMPEWLLNSGTESIKVIGEVENASDFMNSNAIMVVPLLSGSGMKVKIIEGMACGNAIVTTPVGAEGICVQDGNNIFIAQNAEEFAEKISYCISNKDICSKIGFNAYQLIHENYNNLVITNRLITFYRLLMLGRKKNR